MHATVSTYIFYILHVLVTKNIQINEMNTVDILSHIHVHDASKFIPTCSPTLGKVFYLGFYSRRNKPPVVVGKVCMKNCKFVNEWIVAKKKK